VTIVAVSMGFNAFRRPAMLTAGANLPGADMNPCAVPLVAAAILLAAAPALKAADLANEPARRPPSAQGRQGRQGRTLAPVRLATHDGGHFGPNGATLRYAALRAAAVKPSHR
jgi:hypothetical protein